MSEKLTIDCGCYDKSHMLCFESDDFEGEIPELLIHSQRKLNLTFFERLRDAYRVLFNRWPEYTPWFYTMVNEDDVNRLTVFLHQHRNKLNRFKEKNENQTRGLV